MPARANSGAIEDFDLVRFGGPTRVQEDYVLVGTGKTELIGPNPDRVLVIITNNGPNLIRFSTKSDLTATASQQIGANQTITYQVQDDGALCGVRLWAFADVAASDVNVLSVIRDHKG